MLSVLLPLAIFVTFCEAQCKFIPLEYVSGKPREGCKDLDGTMHAFNSQWVSDCEQCSCDEIFGIQCCSMLMKPILYDKDNCLEIFRADTCTIDVVQKINPSKACKVSKYGQ